MAWGTPERVKRTLGALQDKYPDLSYVLHLHDTRGMGIANAYAGLEMGVAHFDACVAGLGGCPFAGHKGAAGNVCTEDLAFMCAEMGIDTGLDLEKLIECARLAEDIVGHPLPGSVMVGGSLARLRQKLAAAAERSHSVQQSPLPPLRAGEGAQRRIDVRQALSHHLRRKQRIDLRCVEPCFAKTSRVLAEPRRPRDVEIIFAAGERAASAESPIRAVLHRHRQATGRSP